jgi:hypothetical protein
MTLLVPIQYILSLRYFKHDHFYDIILKHGYNKKFLNTLNILTILSFFTSIIYFLICVTLAIKLNLSCLTKIDNLIFNNINRQIYIGLLVINKFITAQIFFSVNIFFTSTLLQHGRSIKNLSKQIENNIEHNISNNINIYEIIIDYLDQKYNHNETIDKLNNIFSITFLISGTYIYTILYDIFINKHITNNYIDYIRVIFFGSFIFIFAYTQNKLNKSINKINKHIYNPLFVKQLLSRIDINHEPNNVYQHKDDNLIELRKKESFNIYSYIFDKENANYLNWLAISHIINIQWETISFLGFELNGWNIINQIIVIASSFVILVSALK